jgi:hypothetical protein
MTFCGYNPINLTQHSGVVYSTGDAANPTTIEIIGRNMFVSGISPGTPIGKVAAISPNSPTYVSAGNALQYKRKDILSETIERCGEAPREGLCLLVTHGTEFEKLTGRIGFISLPIISITRK